MKTESIFIDCRSVFYRLIVSMCFTILMGCTCSKTPLSRTTDLQIFAASSLKDAFEEMARSFETEHPQARLVLQFAGSHILRMQIEHGAPADLFVPADPLEFKKLPADLQPPSISRFASNRLVLLARKDAAREIPVEFSEVALLERMVLGSEDSPIGRYTREALSSAAQEYGQSWLVQLMDRVVSFEANVRLVRSKVFLGEVDGAIVYMSDVEPRPEFIVQEIPTQFQPKIEYALATLPSSSNKPLAALFTDWVVSEAGQDILRRHGFAPVADLETKQ